MDIIVFVNFVIYCIFLTLTFLSQQIKTKAMDPDYFKSYVSLTLSDRIMILFCRDATLQIIQSAVL